MCFYNLVYERQFPNLNPYSEFSFHQLFWLYHANKCEPKECDKGFIILLTKNLLSLLLYY